MAEQEFYGIRALSEVDAFAIAAANSLMPEMKLLLKVGTDLNGIASYCGGTALHEAAGLGLIRSVEFLIGVGANLDVIDRMGLTPLMSACSLGKIKGTRVALRLIEAGADVNYNRGTDEMTALKFAAKSGPAPLIQALIDRGAEVDGPAGTDQTALMLAARANNIDALEVLIRHGADPSLQCGLKWAGGRTAEGLAQMEGRRAAYAFLCRVRLNGSV